MAVDADAASERLRQIRILRLPASTTVPGPRQVQNAVQLRTATSPSSDRNAQGRPTPTSIRQPADPAGGRRAACTSSRCTRAVAAPSYPLLQQGAWCRYGDKIGFGPRLDEALDAVFGVDDVRHATAGPSRPPAHGSRRPPATRRRQGGAARTPRRPARDGRTALKNERLGRRTPRPRTTSRTRCNGGDAQPRPQTRRKRCEARRQRRAERQRTVRRKGEPADPAEQRLIRGNHPASWYGLHTTTRGGAAR